MPLSLSADGAVLRRALGSLWSLGLLLSAPLLSAPAAAAQNDFDIYFSISGNDTLASGPVRDEEILRHAPGGASHVAIPSETLALLFGPQTSSLYPTFNDIDALHDGGNGPTADAGLYISLTVNEHGFTSGDVLRLGPNGVSVFRSEAQFVAATGATDGKVNVDAFHLDADGSILFSFADNENSSFLSGDVQGQIRDGDILYWPAGLPTASILLTESQVDSIVSFALGVNTTTTDTTGLARHPVSGELLFCVLSPTPHDATVFSVANGGTIVAGHAEAQLGLVAPEMDALTVAVSRFPTLTVNLARPQPGETLRLAVHGAEPGLPIMALAAHGIVPGGLKAAGWGGMVLAPDALFQATLALPGLYLGVSDALGAASVELDVPVDFPPLDVVFQVIELGATARVGNPLIVQFSQ